MKIQETVVLLGLDFNENKTIWVYSFLEKQIKMISKSNQGRR